MRTRRIFTLIAILFSFQIEQSIASNYEQAWELIKQNNIAEATSLLEIDLQQDINKEKTLLSLAFIKLIHYQYEKSFEYLREYALIAEEPNPALYAFYYFLLYNPDISENLDEIESFYNNLKSSGKLNEFNIALSNDIMSRHYVINRKLNQASKARLMIGGISKWEFAGVFENISGSGFNKNYPPIKNPKSDSKFLSKMDAEIGWNNFKFAKDIGWIDLTKHFDYSNSIIYAQTFVHSDSSKKCHLRIGTSGSIKAWINDSLAISEPDERNNGLDTYVASVQLNKGYNRILLQLGESELGSLNFICRITDTNGKVLEDLTFLNTYKEYEKYSGPEPVALKNENEIYAINKVETEPDDFLNYIILANMYLINQKKDELRFLLDKMELLAPDFSYIYWLKLNVLRSEADRTNYSKITEKIKKFKSKNLLSFELLYNEAISNAKYSDARNYITKIAELTGDSPSIMSKLIQLASIERQVATFTSLIEEAYKKYPKRWDFVSLYYLTLMNRDKNPEKGIKILEEFNNVTYESKVHQELLNQYFALGQTDKGLSIIDEIFDFDPYNPSNYELLGGYYFDKRDFKKSIEHYQKALELNPYKFNLLQSIAKCYEELKDSVEAVKWYSQGIEHYPYAYSTREKIRELSGKKPLFDLLPQYSPDSIDLPADLIDNYYDEPALTLMHDVQVIVYKNGGYEKRTHQHMRILSYLGIDYHKETYIPYRSDESFNIENALVIKPDGSTVKADVKDNHIVFTGLMEGDDIFLSYTISKNEGTPINKFFWDKHAFRSWQTNLNSRYTLLVEPSYRFEYKVLGNVGEPIKSGFEGFDMYVWEKRNSESIKYEGLMPPIVDISDILFISSIPDWDYVSKWYYDLSYNKSKPDYEVSRLVEELFKSNEIIIASERGIEITYAHNGSRAPLKKAISNDSDLSKAKTIYDYIVTNIRYSYVEFRQSGMIPQKAAHVIASRIGDCKDVATLFVAMCRELGLTANLVLINTRDNGRNDLLLPSPDFDHAIARVILDGREFYVELTSDYNGFGTVSGGLLKSTALNISNDELSEKPFILDPMSRLKNSIIRESNISFDSTKMIINKSVIKAGGEAATFRSFYRDYTREEQEQTMRQQVITEFPDVELTGLQFDESLNSIDEEAKYSYSYIINDVFTPVAGLSIFKLPWSDIHYPNEFMNSPKRLYPICFWGYEGIDFVQEKLIISIPKGKILAEIPKSVFFSSKLADYSIEFKYERNELIAVRKLIYKDDCVLPEDYTEFKRFFRNVILSDSKLLAFK